MRRYPTAALISLLLSSAAVSQFTERIDVRVHELEVVVETRDGKPVTDLQKDDFIVLQDGVEQTITNFSVVNESAATASASARAAEAPRSAAAPPRKPRKFIFYLDEFAMHDTTRKDLLRQCAELVGVMREGDEAMVVTPASPQRIPLFFTPDKTVLMTTLDRVTSEMMRKEPVLQLDHLGGESPSSPDDRVLRRGDCGQSPQKCAEERLGVLRSVVEALGQLPGKKVLVLMTTQMTSVPGLTLTNPGETPSDTIKGLLRPGIVSEFRDLRRLVNEVGRTAAANNVLIYGLETYEPGNQALPGVSVEEGRTSGHDNASLTRSSKRGQEGTQDLLLTLADTTGGRAFSGTREAGEMFEQISQDLAVYYSIGYRDTESKAKGHKVEVRLRNHPELVVRTRRNVRTQTAEDEERGKAMSAVLSSSIPNPLGIRLTASPLVRKGRTLEIPIHVHVPLSRLTFAEDGDKYTGQFKVLVAAVGEHADFGQSQVEHAQDIVVPQARWAAAQTQEFRYDTTVRVSPGRYRIAVGVTDMNSGESGFQTFTVNAQ